MELVKIFCKDGKLFVNINECIYSLKGYFGSLLGDELSDELIIKDKKLKECLNETIGVNDSGEHYQFFALIDKNVIVAKACIFYNTNDNYAINNKRIYITSLGVLNSRRNQGIGTLFMNKLFDYFKGYQITIGVEPSNKIAYHFYEKLGFKCFKEELLDTEHMIIYDLLVKFIRR